MPNPINGEAMQINQSDDIVCLSNIEIDWEYESDEIAEFELDIDYKKKYHKLHMKLILKKECSNPKELEGKPICVRHATKDIIFFAGKIDNDVVPSHDTNGYYIEINAKSNTIDLARVQRTRSFQDKDMTYKQLADEVLSKYENARCICTPSLGQEKVGNYFFIQCRETPLTFLTRVFSKHGQKVIGDPTGKSARIWIGFPENIGEADIDDRVIEDWRIGDIRGGKKIIKFSATRWYPFGSVVIKSGVRYIVTKIDGQKKSESLSFDYTATKREGIHQKKLTHPTLSKESCQGTVMTVEGSRIKVQIKNDEPQNLEKLRLIPYVGEMSNGIRMIPKKDDLVRLKLYDEDKEPIAYSSQIIAGSKSSQSAEVNGGMSDPKEKSITTEEGSEFAFRNPGIFVGANDGGHSLTVGKNGVKLSSNGPMTMRGQLINFGSTGKIGMIAENEASFYAGSGNISGIIANSQLHVQALQTFYNTLKKRQSNAPATITSEGGYSGLEGNHAQLLDEDLPLLEGDEFDRLVQGDNDGNMSLPPHDIWNEEMQEALDGLVPMEAMSSDSSSSETKGAQQQQEIPFTQNLRLTPEEEKKILDSTKKRKRWEQDKRIVCVQNIEEEIRQVVSERAKTGISNEEYTRLTKKNRKLHSKKYDVNKRIAKYDAESREGNGI